MGTDPTPDDRELFARPRQIAAWWHLVGYLMIVLGITAWGFHTQQAGMGSRQPADPGQLGNHGAAISFYLTSILGDCALFYYCWVGVHRHGGTLATLTGGRWASWQAIARDVAIAVPFWVLWELVATGVWRLLGASTAKSVSALLPQSPLEIAVWIGVSTVAGFTEEIQSRGYLQQQLHAWSGSIVVAVLGQAIFFGIEHSYQGWKNTVVIAVLGVLYGVLAVWRRNLRANMIAHAWSDVWEGWLKFLVWK
ncbi:MAG TPA: CPBP family intramembrane glutamic endopeptidase [Rhodanobacter sp.]